MKGELKTPNRPNNNSAQRWRVGEGWRDEEQGKVYESCSLRDEDKELERRKFMGICELGQEYVLKKKKTLERVEEGGTRGFISIPSAMGDE